MVSSFFVFGNCTGMKEVPDSSVQLVVTSPPYYNAPFNYPNLFKDSEEFTDMIKDVAKELFRVLERGRIACLATDDMLVNGQEFPLVADITKIMRGRVQVQDSLGKAEGVHKDQQEERFGIAASISNVLLPRQHTGEHSNLSEGQIQL